MGASGELSLGWRTELVFPRFDGEVIEHGDRIVVRTPANPTYHWGNFVLFDEAPRPGDAARWIAAFDADVWRGGEPASRHLAFGVASAGAFALPDDFTAAGLAAEVSTTLLLRPDRLRPPPRALPAGCTAGPVDIASNAAALVDLQVDADRGAFDPGGYRVFRERQMRRYRALNDAGLGQWFAVRATVEGRSRLVADCGLFRDPERPLGRYQYVSTHPDWRRRGLCTALVHAVARHGFETMGLEALVIAADPDDVAIGIYESIGFERHDDMRRIYCSDRSDRPR